MKLFLGCITNYREFENIKDLVNTTKDVVNGFTITVDSNYPSEDKEKYQEFCNFLEENKKDGKIVYHPYNKAHDWQTNEYLHCGIIKNEDYLWIFDSKELPSDLWVKTIHQSILKCEKENWGAIFFSGRPYLLKFWDHFQCLWSPHWMIHGFIAPVMQGTDQMKKDLIINKRDLIPWLHYSVHNTKYYYEHGRSNQMDLAYGKYGQGVVKFHENERFKFRHYCRKVLNLDFILDSLENYMKGGNFTDEFINWVELEFCLSEFYQIKILHQDFITTMHPRYKWSFRNQLTYNDGWYDKNYESTIIKYDKLYLNK